jgi:hypothetical protein
MPTSSDPVQHAFLLECCCCYHDTSPHRALLSIMTLGRTGGGGTGSTLMRNQSGLLKAGLKPSALQSSSLMPARILWHARAVSSCDVEHNVTHKVTHGSASGCQA